MLHFYKKNHVKCTMTSNSELYEASNCMIGLYKNETKQQQQDVTNAFNQGNFKHAINTAAKRVTNQAVPKKHIK